MSTTRIRPAPPAGGEMPRNGRRGPEDRLLALLELGLPVQASRPAVEALVGRVLAVGLACALIALAVQSVADLTNAYVLDDRFRAIDADEDGSVFTWPAMAATFAAGFAAFLLHLVHGGWRLVALALTFAFFSFDDFFGLHERVGRLDDDLGLEQSWNLRYLWPLVFLPMFAFAASMLWLLGHRLSDRVSRFLHAGLALLAGAIVLEIVTPVMIKLWSEESWQVDLEIVVEEGAELVGWILIATGLTALVCRSISRLERRF